MSSNAARLTSVANRPFNSSRGVRTKQASKAGNELLVTRGRVPFGPALLGAVAVHTFEVLRVGVSVWKQGMEWYPIHREQSIVAYEYEYGADAKRHAYNAAKLAKVVRTRKLVHGEHAGFHDLFVPVTSKGQLLGVLVSGPFVTSWPTSAGILANWRKLTGRQGDPADAEFASYLAATLGTLVLEGEDLRTFERFLVRFAQMMAGQEPADSRVPRSDAAQAGAELERLRLAEHAWAIAEEMLDERRSRSWHTLAVSANLRRLGLSKVPDAVLVGLAVGRRAMGDAIEEAVACNAWQRRVAEIVHAGGDAIAGRVGDHGVVLLSSATGSAERKRKQLRALASRISTLARRDADLSVHWGGGAALGAVPLDRSYRAALAAAEMALVRGIPMVAAEVADASGSDSPRRLRCALGRAVRARPDLIAPEFDRYVAAVLSHVGTDDRASRRHLEAGFEWVASTLVQSGELDERSFTSLAESLERAAAEAPTLRDLASAYQRAVRELAEAVKSPVSAGQERGLRRAMSHIARHYAEPLRRRDVARVAGFAPDYFSRLFKKTEGKTFEEYVARLRIDRAKQLLTNTGLGTNTVAEMCGFMSAQYFCHAFRAATGFTPGEYRARPITVDGRGRAGRRRTARRRTAQHK